MVLPAIPAAAGLGAGLLALLGAGGEAIKGIAMGAGTAIHGIGRGIGEAAQSPPGLEIPFELGRGKSRRQLTVKVNAAQLGAGALAAVSAYGLWCLVQHGPRVLVDGCRVIEHEHAGAAPPVPPMFPPPPLPLPTPTPAPAPSPAPGPTPAPQDRRVHIGDVVPLPDGHGYGDRLPSPAPTPAGTPTPSTPPTPWTWPAPMPVQTPGAPAPGRPTGSTLPTPQLPWHLPPSVGFPIPAIPSPGGLIGAADDALRALVPVGSAAAAPMPTSTPGLVPSTPSPWTLHREQAPSIPASPSPYELTPEQRRTIQQIAFTPARFDGALPLAEEIRALRSPSIMPLPPPPPPPMFRGPSVNVPAGTWFNDAVRILGDEPLFQERSILVRNQSGRAGRFFLANEREAVQIGNPEGWLPLTIAPATFLRLKAKYGANEVPAEEL